MMRKHLGWFVISGALIAGTARGDVLIRMDETATKGTFKGGTDAAVMFDVAGQVQQIPLGDILAILFSPRPPSSAAAKAPAAGSGKTVLLLADGSAAKGTFKGGTDAAVLLEVGGQVQQINLDQLRLLSNAPPAPVVAGAATPAAAASGTLPTGTKLLVELTQNVTTASHTKGALVEGILAAPVTIGGSVLVPQGTVVRGTVVDSRGGKVVGGSYIMISFTELQIGNDRVPIATSEVGAEAGRGGTLKKVGAGALIGAAAGDAGAGALVGAGISVLAGGGNHLQIAKGTKAEVSLTKDVVLGK